MVDASKPPCERCGRPVALVGRTRQPARHRCEHDEVCEPAPPIVRIRRRTAGHADVFCRHCAADPATIARMGSAGAAPEVVSTEPPPALISGGPPLRIWIQIINGRVVDVFTDHQKANEVGDDLHMHAYKIED